MTTIKKFRALGQNTEQEEWVLVNNFLFTSTGPFKSGLPYFFSKKLFAEFINPSKKSILPGKILQIVSFYFEKTDRIRQRFDTQLKIY